jgi:ABC-type transport system substrate-binding protein
MLSSISHLLLILALALSIVERKPASALQIDVPLDQALVLKSGESTNPRDYDPATTFGGGDKLAFSGLVSLDPNLNLIPDLAESWDVSADGTVYTFHLHTNAKFHDGRPVTAQDVIYSWERSANPDLDSDTVLTYLGDIVGIQQVASGQSDHAEGLQALDEHTLIVTIDISSPTLPGLWLIRQMWRAERNGIAIQMAQDLIA